MANGTSQTLDVAAAGARLRNVLCAVRVSVASVVAAASLCGASVPSCMAAEQGSEIGIVSRIRRQPVESRALAAVGYSKRLRVLEVEFKRGGTYRYLDVPWSVYRELLAADSKAGFYNRNVRGKYKSLYVRPRQKQ